jgi:energy-converting hydrogenase Eha subunit B
MKRNWKHIIIALALMALYFVVVQSQQPVPKPPTPEQEAEAAQKDLVKAGGKLDAAFAEYNIAAANRNAALYKLIGENGIKPSECIGPGPDGKPIPFACVIFDATGKVTVTKPKPAEAAKTETKRP